MGQVKNGRALPLHGREIELKHSVQQECHELESLKVGALAVLDGGRLGGDFSERDDIRNCNCRKRNTEEAMVPDIMTAEPSTIEIDASVAEALSSMTSRGFRQLPVLDADATVGLLSMRDTPTEHRLMFERYVE